MFSHWYNCGRWAESRNYVWCWDNWWLLLMFWRKPESYFPLEKTPHFQYNPEFSPFPSMLRDSWTKRVWCLHSFLVWSSSTVSIQKGTQIAAKYPSTSFSGSEQRDCGSLRIPQHLEGWDQMGTDWSTGSAASIWGWATVKCKRYFNGLSCTF